MWPNATLGGDLTYEPCSRSTSSRRRWTSSPKTSRRRSPGPDADRWLEDIRAYEQAGYTHIYFHQIGRDQEGFLRFWSEELEPKL